MLANATLVIQELGHTDHWAHTGVPAEKKASPSNDGETTQWETVKTKNKLQTGQKVNGSSTINQQKEGFIRCLD